MDVNLLADRPHEIKKIAKWYYDEWSHLDPDITEEIMQKYVADKSVNRNEIPLALVMHENNELVGVAELKYRENRNYPEYEHWLGGVFVAPCKRGKGIASVLISETINKAVSLGVKALYLQCENRNAVMYSKQGFQEVHNADHHGIPTTIMMWLAVT